MRRVLFPRMAGGGVCGVEGIGQEQKLDEFPFSAGYGMRRLAAWEETLQLISSC